MGDESSLQPYHYFYIIEDYNVYNTQMYNFGKTAVLSLYMESEI